MVPPLTLHAAGIGLQTTGVASAGVPLAPSAVKGELRVAGSIRSDGIFTVKDADQFVSGAFSLDGKEAGYLFERNVGGGLFRGRTLWGR